MYEEGAGIYGLVYHMTLRWMLSGRSWVTYMSNNNMYTNDKS